MGQELCPEHKREGINGWHVESLGFEDQVPCQKSSSPLVPHGGYFCSILNHNHQLNDHKFPKCGVLCNCCIDFIPSGV